MNTETARRNLLDLRDILDAYGVQFVLLYGTLLGAYRDGDFIAHDKDIDIGVRANRLYRLRAALHEKSFHNRGFKLKRDWPGIFSVKRDGVYIDIYVFKKLHSHYACDVWEPTDDGPVQRTHLTLSHVDLERPSAMQFCGVPFRCPDPEPFLERMYGPDWRTPIENKPAPAWQ